MCHGSLDARASPSNLVSESTASSRPYINLSRELAWPFLLLFARKLEGMRQHLSRQIMGDSIIFEDALGRLRHLPHEFFQHWDVRFRTRTRGYEFYLRLANIRRYSTRT